MRIIAGEYSSRKLEAPKGTDTRPTLDKVREAVFSSLGTYFDGGVFLDLYAGSGANGFEALSRGMDRAVFVDSSRAAISVIKKNAASLACTDRCRILPMKDKKALALLHEEGQKFDLVYLDPPYAKQTNDDILMYLYDQNMLNKDCRIVIESAKEDIFLKEYNDLKLYKESVYGITRISYYRYEGD